MRVDQTHHASRGTDERRARMFSRDVWADRSVICWVAHCSGFGFFVPNHTHAQAVDRYSYQGPHDPMESETRWR